MLAPMGRLSERRRANTGHASTLGERGRPSFVDSAGVAIPARTQQAPVADRDLRPVDLHAIPPPVVRSKRDSDRWSALSQGVLGRTRVSHGAMRPSTGPRHRHISQLADATAIRSQEKPNFERRRFEPCRPAFGLPYASHFGSLATERPARDRSGNPLKDRGLRPPRSRSRSAVTVTCSRASRNRFAEGLDALYYGSTSEPAATVVGLQRRLNSAKVGVPKREPPPRRTAVRFAELQVGVSLAGAPTCFP